MVAFGRGGLAILPTTRLFNDHNENFWWVRVKAHER